jgi:hypothetical protein
VNASYPLMSLRGRTPLWMLNLIADLYETEIRGTHAFDIRHPRARWLELVVSDREECSTRGCDERARWEEDAEHAWCGRCANAEIAIVAAARLRAVRS